MSKINLDKKTGSKLLDRLQEESWQLELIVSGIIIFLLLGLHPFTEDLGAYLSRLSLGSSPMVGIFTTVFGFLYIAYLALIGIFLFHLAIRGLWIGAIGLRSVSGDFDHEQLGYIPKYTRFLKRRLGSFDEYITRLERNASVTFSLAFLLFFAIFSIGLFFMAMVGGIFVITLGDGNISGAEQDAMGPVLFTIVIVLIITWLVLLLITGLLYLIDFITFGWFKKRSWFGKVYYPFYRFLGWVTLARLYRPFYYNIIDNRFGRKLVRVYLAATFFGMVLTMIQPTPFANFAYSGNVRGTVNAKQYVDQGVETSMNTLNYRLPSLGSRYATKDYLELFVPLNELEHKRILEYRFPDLQPLSPSSVGFFNRMRLQDLEQSRVDSTLDALTSIYRIQLNDSIVDRPLWRFYEHPDRGQPGLLYDIPVYDLPRGEYWVTTQRQAVRRDSFFWVDIGVISFMR